MTYEQKLRAAVLLFQTVEREVIALPLSSVFSPLLLLCFPFFLFFSVCFFFTSRSSSCFSLVPLTFLSQSLSLVSNFLVFFSSSLYRLLYFLFFLFSLLFSFFFSLFFFFMLALSGIYRAKGSGGVPIAALSLCMGSGVFLPCHDAGLSGQWVWIVGHDPRGSHQ